MTTLEQSTRRLLTWINHLPDRCWFWVPVFGLLLARVVMSRIVVTATMLNCRCRSGPRGWFGVGGLGHHPRLHGRGLEDQPLVGACQT